MEKRGHYNITTVVAARQAHIRNGLQMLLGSFSHIDIVGAYSSCEEVETVLEDARPDLLVMDATGCPDGFGEMLNFIRQHYPRTRCIVIAENIRQQKIALDAGAHAVLLQGFMTVEILDLIETLMFNMRASQYATGCECGFEPSHLHALS